MNLKHKHDIRQRDLPLPLNISIVFISGLPFHINFDATDSMN